MEDLQIPSRKSAASYRADEWDVNKWTREGALKVISKGEECIIRLEDKSTGVADLCYQQILEKCDNVGVLIFFARLFWDLAQEKIFCSLAEKLHFELLYVIFVIKLIRIVYIVVGS